MPRRQSRVTHAKSPRFVPSFHLLLFSLPFLRPRNNLSNLLQKLGGDRGKQIEAALTRGTSQKMTTNSSTFFTTIYIHALSHVVIISHSLPKSALAFFFRRGTKRKIYFLFSQVEKSGSKTAINVVVQYLFFAPLKEPRGSTKGVMGRTEVEELCVLPPTIPHGSSPQSPHSPLFLIYLGR